MKWLLIVLIPFCAAFSILSGCSPVVDKVSGDTITTKAKYLTLIKCDGFVAAEIRTPWGGDEPIGRYVFVSHDAGDLDLPRGYEVIKTPLSRSVVFSSIYSSAINELGSIDAVTGVADFDYYDSDDIIVRRVRDGKVSDVGSSMSPLVEKIIDLDPDAVLLSPFSGSSTTGLEKIGIPLIWMADYLEPTPEGRAEWLLLLGELFGKSEMAEKIYNDAVSNYDSIRLKALSAKSRPKVITEKPMSGVWYVPGGKSYMARMIADAGGNYPWAHTNDTGSLPLDEAAIIDKGIDADFWLIKDTRNLTSDELISELPRARILESFPDGTYICNTITTPYYKVIAFHPDVILAEMAAIFHPEIFNEHKLRFFKKMR